MRTATALLIAAILVSCGGKDGAEGDTGHEGDPADDDVVVPDEGEAEPDGAVDVVDEEVVEDPYPNVARLGVPESFTRQPDGSYDITTGEEMFDVGHAFYDAHPDDYDQIVVYTEFRVNTGQFSVVLQPDAIQGIGLDEVMALYGWSSYTPAMAGSAGRLQQIILMNDRSLLESYSFPPQDILTHEVGHRWSANLSLPSPPAPEDWVLTDTWYAHWNVYASVGGPSAVGYGELTDNGDGTFTYGTVIPLSFSTLELYQQGLIAPADVGQLFYVTGATGFVPSTCLGTPFDAHSYCCPVTYSGTRVDFTIDDVIADKGPRVPSHADAQTAFRMAFVLVCEEASLCSGSEIAWVDGQRTAWESTFPDATGGRATVDTTL